MSTDKIKLNESTETHLILHSSHYLWPFSWDTKSDSKECFSRIVMSKIPSQPPSYSSEGMKESERLLLGKACEISEKSTGSTDAY